MTPKPRALLLVAQSESELTVEDRAVRSLVFDLDGFWATGGHPMPDLEEPAVEAERRILSLAQKLVGILDRVHAPSELTEDHLPEQLSFIQLRENYRCFVGLVLESRDVPAAHLARALFEESVRWSWVDEESACRREAFLGEAGRAYRLISEAAGNQGIDPAPLFAPFVEERLLPAAEGAQRFPSRFEELLDWTQPGLREMLYLQYRLLSQYTHSSLLSAASTCRLTTELESRERLPLAARFMVIRNACASVGFVLDFCKTGLEWRQRRSEPPLNFQAFGITAEISEIAYPFSPGSA